MNSKTDKSEHPPQTWLQIAQLRAEKCELREAKTAYFFALSQAKKKSDLRSTMEALAGLLRLASEAMDSDAVAKWEVELDQLMKAHPRQTPPMAWFCKGAVARHQKNWKLSQRLFHRYLKGVRRESRSEEAIAKGWIMLATVLQERRRLGRAEWLARELLKRYEFLNLKGINGILCLLLGTLSEYQKQYPQALTWFQKAHGYFIAEHNWYYLLYVLYGYARIDRHLHKYSEAAWNLDLVSKAIAHPEFRNLQRLIAFERQLLEADQIDLIVDPDRGIIKTREGEPISMRKQHILLGILEALAVAHNPDDPKRGRGLSKAEIIESVWKEPYRPDDHDNKLYYNINRLRKLLEQDVHQPNYLLNWKEGYRLAPGLRVRLIGDRTTDHQAKETHP